MPEFINKRAGQAFTLDPVVSPVADSELVAWLSLPATEPVLAGLLKAATSAVISYIGRDLLTREWKLTHWDWPAFGTRHLANVGRDTGTDARLIDLPYGPAQSVESVERYGEATTDYVLRDSDIVINGWSSDGSNQEPALVVEYTAGFGDLADDVPDAIKQAILQLAAFNYEHRGSCDAMEAMKKSGAAELLIPWRKAELLW
jgi:uncharacterized phiE125 gp8 family phage protein